MSYINKKFSTSFLANSGQQAVGLLTQFATVPVFLYFWSPEEVGHWLMISAIPVYLSMTDFGILGSASNKLVILVEQQSRDIVESYWLVLLSLIYYIVAGIFIFGVLSPAIIFSALFENFYQKYSVAGCLVAYSCLCILSSLAEVRMRVLGGFVIGTNLATLGRLIEWIAVSGVLAATQNQLAMALSMCIARFFSLMVMVVAGARLDKLEQFSFMRSRFNKLYAKEILKDGVAFLMFPAGNALQLQGVILTIGAILGPACVTVYSIYRTVSRAVVQISTLVNRSAWPVITQAYAKNDNTGVANLYGRVVKLCFWGCSVAAVIFYLMGEEIIGFASKGAVYWDGVIFSCMLVSAVVCGMWQCPMTLLNATNRHQQFAKIFSFMSLASVLIFGGVMLLLDKNNFSDRLNLVVGASIILFFECVVGIFAIWSVAKYRGRCDS